MAQTDTFNADYSRYYNLLYADKDYQSEAQYVAGLIQKYAPDTRRILELGCGTGNHAVILKAAGFEITGVERSAEMADIARSRGIQCVVADIAEYTMQQKFDVCISLFHVVSYINENGDLLRVFNNARSHLKAGGIFIFDVWFTPAVMHNLPEVRVKRLEDDDVSILRIAEPRIDHMANTVDVNYEIISRQKNNGNVSSFRESHRMRHFSVPEVKLLAVQSGFSFIHAEEFLTGNRPGTDTWGVNFILKAI